MSPNDSSASAPTVHEFIVGTDSGNHRLGRRFDVPQHGLMVGGYTRDGDAEPGSRCESDAVLATL